MKNTTAAVHHPLTRLFHWGMAPLIVGMLALGFLMEGIPKGPVKGNVMDLHKLVGTLLLLLTIARLFWVAAAGHPPTAPGEPAWQRLAARGAHIGLYVAMLGMAGSGFLASNFSRGVKFFGIALPQFGGLDPELGKTLMTFHMAFEWFLLTLLVLHVLAAAWHHYVRRDGTLARMLA